MIADAVKNLVTKLIKKTNQSEILWDVCNVYLFIEKGFPDFFDQARSELWQDEYRQLLVNNSFFFFHKEGVVALLRIDNESGKDGSHNSEYAIGVQLQRNSPPFFYNLDGLQPDFQILYCSILDYHNRNISLPDDLYEFFSLC